MKRKSLRELKELVLKDIECNKNFLNDEYIQKDQNPQVIEMKTSAKSRIEAMESILEYIQTGAKYGFRKD